MSDIVDEAVLGVLQFPPSACGLLAACWNSGSYSQSISCNLGQLRRLLTLLSFAATRSNELITGSSTKLSNTILLARLQLNT